MRILWLVFIFTTTTYSLSAQHLDGVITEYRFREKVNNSITYFGDWCKWKSINASIAIYSGRFVINDGEIETYYSIKAGEPKMDVDGNLDMTYSCRNSKGEQCFVSMITQNFNKPYILRVVQDEIAVEYVYELEDLESSSNKSSIKSEPMNSQTPTNNMERESRFYEWNNSVKDQNINFSKYNLVVVVEKAYFYTEPNESTKRKGYLVKGERFMGQKTENGFVYTEFTNPAGKQSVGWIKLSDICK